MKLKNLVFTLVNTTSIILYTNDIRSISDQINKNIYYILVYIRIYNIILCGPLAAVVFRYIAHLYAEQFRKVTASTTIFYKRVL